MSSSSSALPLKVAPNTPAKSSTLPSSTPTRSNSDAQKPSAPGSLKPSDISSPHELTAFVEKLLEQLDTKFDDMSGQMLDKMNQMSARVDALELSIQDIINGDVTAPSIPPSPSPFPPDTSGALASSRNGSGN